MVKRLSVRLKGNDHTSAQQLLESLWAYEEWKCERHIDTDADIVALAEQLRRHHLNDVLSGPNPSASASAPAEDVFHAHAEHLQSLAADLCCVCMDAPRAVVLIPCGHLAVCQRCSSRLPQCPICRAVIRAAIRSYMS